jgi:hypothetical protein
MRICVILIVAALFFACSDKGNNKSTHQEWQMIRDILYTRVNNKMGFLDTLYEMNRIYHKGNVLDSTRSFVTYQYQKKEKVTESIYYLVNQKPVKIRQKISEFDKTGRPVLERSFKNDTLLSYRKMEYNKEGQVINLVTINADYYDPAEKQTDNDTSVNFQNIHIARYDTLVYNYVYENGLNTKIIIANSQNRLSGEIINIYSGKEKLVSFHINKNDTIRTINYSRERKLDKKVEKYKSPKMVVTTYSFKNKPVKIITENLKSNKLSMEIRKYDKTNGTVQEIKKYERAY